MLDGSSYATSRNDATGGHAQFKPSVLTEKFFGNAGGGHAAIALCRYIVDVDEKSPARTLGALIREIRPEMTLIGR
jgi:3-hydroxy-3-methylglutaryl CoA synthase